MSILYKFDETYRVLLIFITGYIKDLFRKIILKQKKSGLKFIIPLSIGIKLNRDIPPIDERLIIRWLIDCAINFTKW